MSERRFFTHKGTGTQQAAIRAPEEQPQQKETEQPDSAADLAAAFADIAEGIELLAVKIRAISNVMAAATGRTPKSPKPGDSGMSASKALPCR